MADDLAAAAEPSEAELAPPGNASVQRKKCVMSPARLEFLANTLMMPEVMRQYGLVLKQGKGGRAPAGVGKARQGLAAFLNEQNHIVMDNADIGEDGITNWILQLRNLHSAHLEWEKGSAARGRNVNGPKPPSHQQAAYDLFEAFNQYKPPSHNNRYTQPPPGLEGTELVKDDGATIPELEDDMPEVSPADAQKEAMEKVKANRVKRKLDESANPSAPKVKVIRPPPAPEHRPAEDTFYANFGNFMASESAKTMQEAQSAAQQLYQTTRASKLQEIEHLKKMKTSDQSSDLNQMIDVEIKKIFAQYMEMQPPGQILRPVPAQPSVPCSPLGSTGSPNLQSPSASSGANVQSPAADIPAPPVLGGYGGFGA